MKKTKLLLVLAMAVLTSAPAAGQKKPTVEKRERFEFSFELPAYVEQLKQELTYPLSWENSGIKSFKKWQKKARQRVFDCMMTPPRAAAAWDMKIVAEEQRDGYRALRIAFNQNAYARTEALVLVPDGEGPFPAVNLLHDHGAHLYIGKEKMIRPFGVEQAVIDDADAWAKNLYGSQYVGDYLARHGYVCFSADAPMWGERGREEGYITRAEGEALASELGVMP